MLIVETVVRIRREHAGGKAIKAIARDLRLSRKVVRKAIRSPECAFAYERRVQPLPRIGPFQERLDRLLIETDSPYLAPVPYRGKVNNPSYVPYVAQQISETRGIPLAAVAEATSRNFEVLFKGVTP